MELSFDFSILEVFPLHFSFKSTLHPLPHVMCFLRAQSSTKIQMLLQRVNRETSEACSACLTLASIPNTFLRVPSCKKATTGNCASKTRNILHVVPGELWTCFCVLLLRNTPGKGWGFLSRTHHNSSFLFTKLKHYGSYQLTACSVRLMIQTSSQNEACKTITQFKQDCLSWLETTTLPM